MQIFMVMVSSHTYEHKRKQYIIVLIIIVDLLTVPPGFKAGLNFANDNVTISNINDVRNERKLLENNVINLMDVVKEEQKLLGTYYIIVKKICKTKEHLIIVVL